MDFFRQGKSQVGKLRVRGEALDYVSTRLNLERLFSADEFLTANLQSNSIVCIKKIIDPQPLTLKLDQGNLRFAENWRKSVSKKVESLYSRAFKPFREFVPESAECVIFNDNAELLACLATDFCSGKLLENWWWRALFPNLGKAKTVAEIWLEAAEFIPAAMHKLAQKKMTVRFVHFLQTNETKALLKAIVKTFGLAKLDQLIFRRVKTDLPPDLKDYSQEYEVKSEIGFESNSKKIKDCAALVNNLIPESKDSNLNFESRLLLETVLLLARSPKTARSEEYVLVVEKSKFYQQKTDNLRDVKASVEKKKLEKKSHRPDLKIQKQKSPAQSDKPKVKPNSVFSDINDAAVFGKYDERIEPKKDQISFEEVRSETDVENALKEEKKTDEVHFEINKKDDYAEYLKPQIASKKTDKIRSKPKNRTFENFFEPPSEEMELSFQTHFGGVFYLLNLGLYLGLYRDFTEEIETEIDLNIWDFLALLSLEFLGEKVKKDSLWNFLITMAERESDADFGLEIDFGKDWRMPADWLKTFPTNEIWLWKKTRKRLVIQHPASFNVVDVKIKGDAESDLAEELSRFVGCFSRISKPKGERLRKISSKTRLENLSEYIKIRLLQALNLNTTEELIATFFESNASVLVTTTHLEITYGLADQPFSVRMAGIDRDPGWIPAVGKFVYFHFV